MLQHSLTTKQKNIVEDRNKTENLYVPNPYIVSLPLLSVDVNISRNTNIESSVRIIMSRKCFNIFVSPIFQVKT